MSDRPTSWAGGVSAYLHVGPGINVDAFVGPLNPAAGGPLANRPDENAPGIQPDHVWLTLEHIDLTRACLTHFDVEFNRAGIVLQEAPGHITGDYRGPHGGRTAGLDFIVSVDRVWSEKQLRVTLRRWQGSAYVVPLDRRLPVDTVWNGIRKTSVEAFVLPEEIMQAGRKVTVQKLRVDLDLSIEMPDVPRANLVGPDSTVMVRTRSKPSFTSPSIVRGVAPFMGDGSGGHLPATSLYWQGITSPVARWKEVMRRVVWRPIDWTWVKAVWRDPVLSKVIAAGIIVSLGWAITWLTCKPPVHHVAQLPIEERALTDSVPVANSERALKTEQHAGVPAQRKSTAVPRLVSPAADPSVRIRDEEIALRFAILFDSLTACGALEPAYELRTTRFFERARSAMQRFLSPRDGLAQGIIGQSTMDLVASVAGQVGDSETWTANRYLQAITAHGNNGNLAPSNTKPDTLMVYVEDPTFQGRQLRPLGDILKIIRLKRWRHRPDTLRIPPTPK
jgi:hypothetical protein